MGPHDTSSLHKLNLLLMAGYMVERKGCLIAIV